MFLHVVFCGVGDVCYQREEVMLDVVLRTLCLVAVVGGWCA